MRESRVSAGTSNQDTVSQSVDGNKTWPTSTSCVTTGRRDRRRVALHSSGVHTSEHARLTAADLATTNLNDYYCVWSLKNNILPGEQEAGAQVFGEHVSNIYAWIYNYVYPVSRL